MEGEHVGPFNLGNPSEFTMLELAEVSDLFCLCSVIIYNHTAAYQLLGNVLDSVWCNQKFLWKPFAISTLVKSIQIKQAKIHSSLLVKSRVWKQVIWNHLLTWCNTKLWFAHYCEWNSTKHLFQLLKMAEPVYMWSLYLHHSVFVCATEVNGLVYSA